MDKAKWIDELILGCERGPIQKSKAWNHFCKNVWKTVNFRPWFKHWQIYEKVSSWRASKS